MFMCVPLIVCMKAPLSLFLVNFKHNCAYVCMFLCEHAQIFLFFF